jgi:hypothetical protein
MNQGNDYILTNLKNHTPRKRIKKSAVVYFQKKSFTDKANNDQTSK